MKRLKIIITLIIVLLAFASQAYARPKIHGEAIELAKKCIMITYETSGIEISAQEMIEYTLKQEGVFAKGWKVVDVSESVYAVTYGWSCDKGDRFFLFHVIPKDNIAQNIDTTRTKPDMEKYFAHIRTISTYSKEKLDSKWTSLFSD